MKIIHFIDDKGDKYFGTESTDNQAEVLSGDLFGNLVKTNKTKKIKSYLAPLVPKSILCIGLNYKAHAKETGMRLPEYPILFMKNVAAITSHHSNIIIPECCKNPHQVDFEAELAVVIGKAAKNVKAKDAFDYIFGYTIANDVSARTWQRSGGGKQWVRGKSFDTFCPLGPAIITADEGIDPDNLNISLKLNGEIMQESNTSDLIFSVSQLIEFLSEDTSLMPGTVILTGTPSGVGFTRDPPVFLKKGDVVETTIDKIGTLVNGVE
ncbi:MAG: fumarylacetoacetate hydrolase family protein [Deltaproteobacteria bacterium]|jgi:2-keto-4-pentenoate hydratase/2-oxohepta-3-ene-1,7-dioic acid hydratase in catechol pathway|nr:fumarylacetoacetate hydrolase family protein [Deltaproteobacteria bacterium]MBT4526671.1 fumarylacetoacetate hydrolase family protein [Deltaproteobacteria bacterium]